MTRGKFRRIVIFFVLSCFIVIGWVSAFWVNEYRENVFEHISKFCQIIIEDNPEIEMQVLSSLKKYEENTEQEKLEDKFLVQYGYRSSEFIKNIPLHFFIFPTTVFIVITAFFIFCMWYWSKWNRERIVELTSYLEKINIGTMGTMIQWKEDEFSHLQDEIYKTVTSLYETRDAAVTARMNFADNLANIAHQLKTPITASFLSLQLMKKTIPNVYAEQIEKQLKRLNQLEESLLTLSKIDAGTLQFEHSKVDIYTALNLAAENLSDLLEKENILVSIPDKGCVEIEGDLEWTMEAFINLIKNCMEHSVYGGMIYCDYSSNPLYTEILIWDDGNGFEIEDIPHLFERFYRGKTATTNGIGIGLSLARSIFEIQNGTITARNLPEGGACFEIRVYRH